MPPVKWTQVIRNHRIVTALSGIILFFLIGAVLSGRTFPESFPNPKQILPASNSAEVQEESKYIALTFDDGPRRITTERLLDGLQQRGIHATFFVIGEEISGNEDLITRMATEGHQIGNHTWDHVHLNESPENALSEIGRTEAALSDILGGADYWIRPPYGQFSQGFQQQVSVPLIKWSVDPRDWESRDVSQITRAVLKNVKPGDIILLHDIYPTSIDAALQIVDQLVQQNYHFVTVTELLQLHGITPQAGKLYCSAETE